MNQASRVHRLDPWATPGRSLSADGKKIVYSAPWPREEIWTLEDVRIEEPWYAWLLMFLK